MPGAWEREQPSVLVSILTRGVVPTKWAAHFRNMLLPATGQTNFISGMPFDHARNTAVETVLKHKFQWLLFIDDDVLFPADVFFRLSRHNLDIVSGLYFRRNEPLFPVMLKTDGTQSSWVTKFTPNSVLEVDMVGAGCLLINRKVLESIQKPWFEWLCDKDDLPQYEKVSEDFAFCRKAKRSGFKIHVDTSVECMHAGYGRTDTNGTFKPLEG